MRGTIAAMLAFGMAAPAVAEAPGSQTASLRAFADAFDAAQIAQDRAALETMVADDLIFIDGSGQRLGKAAFIAGWTGADDDYDPVALIDRVTLPLGRQTLPRPHPFHRHLPAPRRDMAGKLYPCHADGDRGEPALLTAARPIALAPHCANSHTLISAGDMSCAFPVRPSSPRY